MDKAKSATNRLRKRKAKRNAVKSSIVTGNSELVFDLERIIIPVTIAGETYELKEATGDIAARWQNFMLNNISMRNGKPTGVKDTADSQPLLVSLCLFPKGSEKGVSLAIVRSWPNRVVKTLFERAKEISDLSEENEDTVEAIEDKIEELQEKLEELRENPAKNALKDTTGGSESNENGTSKET